MYRIAHCYLIKISAEFACSFETSLWSIFHCVQSVPN